MIRKFRRIPLLEVRGRRKVIPKAILRLSGIWIVAIVVLEIWQKILLERYKRNSW